MSPEARQKWWGRLHALEWEERDLQCKLLLDRVEALEAELAAARATPPQPDTISEFYQQRALEAVQEWDGQDNQDLLRLLSEKLAEDLTGETPCSNT